MDVSDFGTTNRNRSTGAVAFQCARCGGLRCAGRQRHCARAILAGAGSCRCRQAAIDVAGLRAAILALADDLLGPPPFLAKSSVFCGLSRAAMEWRQALTLSKPRGRLTSAARHFVA